ncbi:MAG: hypothetical protein LBP43_05705, partial [Treponema sp.]|nr:hypothetical protein [Treponema sp.]
MIQVMYFLRFRTQLRRIRREMVDSLEKALTGAFEAAGGKVRQERQLFIASFDENTLGFWMDMLFVIKRIIENLEAASSEIYGYSCVFGRDIPDYDMERLCRALSIEPGGTGIWCSPQIREFLSPYVNFSDPPSPGLNRGGPGRPFRYDYARIDNIKPLMGPAPGELYPFRVKIKRAIIHGARQNAVLLGPEFLGKRDGLYHYCAGVLGEVPPLVVRFGSGGRGLSCFGDALTPKIRSFIADQIPPDQLRELDTLETAIFQERLRDELSKHIVQRSRCFFQLLLKSYITAARGRSHNPVLILENIHRANDMVIRIFMDIYTMLQPDLKSLLIYGTCAAEERLKPWEGIFSRIIKFSSMDVSPPPAPEMPRDLWEIAYAVYLLGMFFPGVLIPRLFEEEGKSAAMISLSLDILSRLGVVDITEDPLPRIHQ